MADGAMHSLSLFLSLWRDAAGGEEERGIRDRIRFNYPRSFLLSARGEITMRCKINTRISERNETAPARTKTDSFRSFSRSLDDWSTTSKVDYPSPSQC